MSTPRTKRPFAGAASDPAQRQITAFFGKATAAPAAAAATRPVLPAATESNLLTVGMRVRKSVPEGYKTGGASSCAALGLFPEHTTPTTTTNTTTRSPARAVPVSTSSTPAGGPRELLPFCAINNTGGLAPEPSYTTAADTTPTTTAPSLLFRPDGPLPSLDDMPSLSSSQASVSSTATTTTTTTRLTPPPLRLRKRSYDDTAADDAARDTPAVSACLTVPSGEWMDGQVSPRSLVPVGEQWRNTRVMAVPRRTQQQQTQQQQQQQQSLRTRATGGAKGWADMERVGQENVEMVLDGADDFPEAEFLDYRLLEGDAMEL